MKNIVTIILLLISGFCFSQDSERTLKVVTFKGSGYELGLQHGKELKTEIADILKEWKKNTSGFLKKDADEVITEFFEYADFEKDIKKWTPELYEEIKGIAEGSEQSLNDILILNLLDETWVYGNSLNNHHCSSIGIPARNGEPGYLAQNMDLESYTDGFQVLMRIEGTANNPEQLILTYPGLVALNGINEKGIGVVVNTLMPLQASSEGLPVAFVVRRLINSTDKAEMLDFIQNVSHASGQNYILGIKGEIYDFEASANKVVQYDPKNDNGSVYHTNHPLVNKDVKPWLKHFDPTQPRMGYNNSDYRFFALETRLSKASSIDENLLMATLKSKDNKDHPVCRPKLERGSFTFSSVIMTLDETPVLKITAGPPDESEYQTFDFNK